MSSYTHIQHQTQLFVFDNTISDSFNSDKDVYDALAYKLDVSNKNGIIEFAVLGIYNIKQGDNYNDEQVYLLTAGAVYSIAMFDKIDKEALIIFEQAFLSIHSNLKVIAENETHAKGKVINFPAPDLQGFHANLHLRLMRLQ